MAEVRALVEIIYPLGSPESYGGETDLDKQVAQEGAYLSGDEGQGDYLIAVLDSDFAKVRVVEVSRQ